MSNISASSSCAFFRSAMRATPSGVASAVAPVAPAGAAGTIDLGGKGPDVGPAGSTPRIVIAALSSLAKPTSTGSGPPLRFSTYAKRYAAAKPGGSQSSSVLPAQPQSSSPGAHRARK
jgi:hypothetical protein